MRSESGSSDQDCEKGLIPQSTAQKVSESFPQLPPANSQWATTRTSVFTVYHVLFTLALSANTAALIAVVVAHEQQSSHASTATLLSTIATAAATNLLAAILIRQDYVNNCMYNLCCLVPLSAPLWIRCRLALVYENGGVHSGCATSSVLWFLAFTVYLTIDRASRSAAVIVLDYILVALLCSIVVCALPAVRAAHHNTFERVHRFSGWTALGVFWVELVLFARSDSSSSDLGSTLAKLPAFWMLLIASLHSVYPWLLLRRIHVTTQKLSDHAILVRHSLVLPPFRGLAIFKSPIREWHPFASFPNKDGTGGGTLIVSKAGDWTRDAIENPRSYYYVKGLPKTGVLTMSTIFRKVIIVTTGSGIGPCLGILVDLPPSVACRVLWSTPTPELIFGHEVVRMVRNIDDKAIIHDTRSLGRPNLIKMAYRLYLESEAEAVFCISNKSLTKKIVYGLRAAEIPAFGPVWDS